MHGNAHNAPVHRSDHSVRQGKQPKGITVSNTTVNVKAIRSAAKTVKRLAYVIAAVGATTSFGTQVALLESWHMPFIFAVGVAATVDLLAICAAIALAIPGFPVRDRKIVGFILFVGLSASIGANITAGLAESVGAAVGHSWPVLAYMGAELIAQRIRNYLAVVEANETATTTPAIVNAIVPTIAATIPTPRAARASVAKAYNAGRAAGSHAQCAHPSTSSDRAACRKARAAA